MIKKLTSLLLLALCLLTGRALACELPTDYVSIATRQSDALLYEVTDCDGQTAYVFGTFHSDSPKLQPIIDHILPYLLRSQTLWVEIKAGPSDSATSMREITLPQSHAGLKSLIGEALYQETLTKIGPALNMADATLDRFRPWALALLVQYPPSEADGTILDTKLQGFALLQGIPVKGLETLESQFQIFHAMPQQMQINFLKSTLEDFDQLQPTTQKLANTYQQQKLQSLYEQSMALLEQTAVHYPRLAQYLQRHLIEQRNIGMAHTLEKNGEPPYFVAVGALHLAGEKGLLQLLENTGRQIRPIPVQ